MPSVKHLGGEPTRLRVIAEIRKALRRSALLVPVTLVPILLCFAFIAYVRLRTGTRWNVFYRDPNAIAENPFYYGFLEYASSIMMLMSASIVFFTALTEACTRRQKRFLYLFGALTFLLGLDDLYMIHESIKFVHSSLREKHVYLFYAAMLLSIFALHHRELLQSPFFLLGFALFCLFAATLEDMFKARPLGFSTEDYLKFIAFSAWSVFAIATAAIVKKHAAPPPREGATADRPKESPASQHAARAGKVGARL